MKLTNHMVAAGKELGMSEQDVSGLLNGNEKFRKFLIEYVKKIRYNERVSLEEPNWTIKRAFRDGSSKSLDDIDLILNKGGFSK